MKLTGTLTILLGAIGVSVVLSQQPPAAPRTGPGVQAPQDAKYADLIATCKVPPPAAPGRGGSQRGGPPKGQGRARVLPLRLAPKRSWRFPASSPRASNGKMFGKWKAIMPTASSPPRMAASWPRRTITAPSSSSIRTAKSPTLIPA